MCLWVLCLNPVMTCRKQDAISWWCADHNGDYWYWCFWWMSGLMVCFSNDVMMFYGLFITRTICTVEIDVWNPWWNVVPWCNLSVNHDWDYDIRCSSCVSWLKTYCPFINPIVNTNPLVPTVLTKKYSWIWSTPYAEIEISHRPWRVIFKKMTCVYLAWHM